MAAVAMVAWLTWDPDPVLFYLPYFYHPLRWYGLLFVSGLFLGSQLLLPMLRSALMSSRVLLPRDIASWPHLVEGCRDALSSPGHHPMATALSTLDDMTRSALLRCQKQLSSARRMALLRALAPPPDSDGTLWRRQLETHFPNALHSCDQLARYYIDKLIWFIVAGTVIGARLGHVFFYDWERYRSHWPEILKVWEGGLASHGAAVGVLLAILFYTRFQRSHYPEIGFVALCDLIAIPTALAAVFIRIGNFINQEILGTVTTVPWAVLFGHPADGSPPLPRHPVQLYEAAAYLLAFFALRALWHRKRVTISTGYITALFFLFIFGMRFILEFFKAEQSSGDVGAFLQRGQLLSLPFITIAVVFLLSDYFIAYWQKKRYNTPSV